jgi:hypothetical protein
VKFAIKITSSINSEKRFLQSCRQSIREKNLALHAYLQQQPSNKQKHETSRQKKIVTVKKERDRFAAFASA